MENGEHMETNRNHKQSLTETSAMQKTIKVPLKKKKIIGLILSSSQKENQILGKFSKRIRNNAEKKKLRHYRNPWYTSSMSCAILAPSPQKEYSEAGKEFKKRHSEGQTEICNHLCSNKN